MVIDTAPVSDLLDTRKLARYLLISERTVRQMRSEGTGPPFARINGRGDVRYRQVDVDAWLKSRVTGLRAVAG